MDNRLKIVIVEAGQHVQLEKLKLERVKVDS